MEKREGGGAMEDKWIVGWKERGLGGCCEWVVLVVNGGEVVIFYFERLEEGICSG